MRNISIRAISVPRLVTQHYRDPLAELVRVVSAGREITIPLDGVSEMSVRDIRPGEEFYTPPLAGQESK